MRLSVRRQLLVLQIDPAIVMRVNEDGTSSIEFLDGAGSVTQRIPGK